MQCKGKCFPMLVSGWRAARSVRQSHWAERRSPAEHSSVVRAQPSPAAPHTRDMPALLATREAWIQRCSLQVASLGAGCRGLVGSRCPVPFSLCTALTLLCISPGTAAAGHCEQSEAACIVRAVSTATSSRRSLFDLHFLHPFWETSIVYLIP